LGSLHSSANKGDLPLGRWLPPLGSAVTKTASICASILASSDRNGDDAIWDVTGFTKNRERLLDGTLPKPSSKSVIAARKAGAKNRN
jgi:hypothetical protein